MRISARNPEWLKAVLAIVPLAVAGCDPEWPGNDDDTCEDKDKDKDGKCPDGHDQPSGHEDDAPPEGYTLELVAGGLTFPTAVAFGHDDRMWVSEAGITGNPRIMEIDHGGIVTPLLTASDLHEGAFLQPLTDVTFAEGLLWVTHRQIGENGWMVGAISVLDPDDPVDSFRTVVTDLPAAGDHSVNEVVLTEDGRLYLSIGSATNSAVVGPDNQLVTGWLAMAPTFHDFPARDVRLSGIEYESENVLDPSATAPAITGPYMPYDSGPVDAGMLVQAPSPANPIEGMISGNSAIYAMNLGAADPVSTLELVAWGLRNPYGMVFDPRDASRLYITNNGADIRGMGGETLQPQGPDFEVLGSRPIANDYDDLYLVDVDAIHGKDDGKKDGKAKDDDGKTITEAVYFGFPDFFHDEITGAPLPVTDPRFCNPEDLDVMIPCPEFVLDSTTHAMYDVERAVAQFELHSSSNKLDISDSAMFGFEGDLFVAQTGSFVPVTGATEFVGYKVVLVDGDTYEQRDFISAGETQEEIFEPDGFNKPIDVKFQRDRMFIVDFGIFEPGLGLQEPGTGKLWVVSADSEDTGVN